MKRLSQYILEHLTISIMENATTSKYKKFEEFINNAKNDIDKHKKSIEFFKNTKNSLRLTLRSLLINGCEVNINNFNHIVNGKPSSTKQKTECIRGNFGPDLETSKNVINFIIKEKFYLTDKDFTISDFKIHPNVSSNSKPSCEIRFNNEVFYVCNNKININNETIVFRSKNFMIKNLVDTNNIYNKEELIKTINTKLEKTQWFAENENYGHWLLNLFKSINVKKQIKTIDELNQLFIDNKKIEIEINDSNIIDTYNALDNVSKNNIKTILGELFCAIEVNQLTGEKVGFPMDHSNMFYDFYVKFKNKEKINISVKHKSSNTGHPIEIKNIIPDDETELDNYSSDFKNILELFKGSREEIVWKLAKHLNIPSYNEIIEILKNDNDYTGSIEKPNKSDLLACINNSNDNIETINNLLYNFTNNDSIKWIKMDNNSTTIEKNRNYSKIMHLFQKEIVNVLNDTFATGDNNEFTKFVSNTYNVKNICFNITEKTNKIILSFKHEIIGSEKYNYVFSCRGTTWNEWCEHSNISFDKHKK